MTKNFRARCAKLIDRARAALAVEPEPGLTADLDGLATKRFELRVKVSFVKKLERLATASCCSKAEVIDRAIGLYAEALKQAENGMDIHFVKKETQP